MSDKLRECVLIVCNLTGEIKETRQVGQGGIRFNDHKVYMIEKSAFDSLKEECERLKEEIKKMKEASTRRYSAPGISTSNESGGMANEKT